MTDGADQRYRYTVGAVAFDESRWELRVDGQPVRLERKPMTLLLLLLRLGGQVLTREAARERLWPHADPVTYVLANAVRKLRVALGPLHESLIVTQAGLGYRLAAEPRREALGSAGAAPEIARLRVAIQQAHSTLNEVDKAIAEGRLAVEAAVRAGGAVSELALLARLQLAADLGRGGAFDEAVTTVNAVQADLARPGGHRPLLHARLEWVRSDLEAFQLQLQAALGSAERACQWLARGARPDAALSDGVRTRLGKAHRMLGDAVGSEAVFRSLLTDQERRDGAGVETTQHTRIQLARSLLFQSRNADALAMAADAAQRLEALIGADNLATLHARDAIASIQFKMTDYAAAATTWRGVVEALQRLSDLPSDFTVSAQANVALSLLYAGQLAHAEAAGRRALEIAKPILAFDSPRVQSIRYQLAFALLDQGRTEGVDVLLDGLDGSALTRAIQAADWEGRIAYQLARLAFFERRLPEALAHVQQALRVLQACGSTGLVSQARAQGWAARIEQAWREAVAESVGRRLRPPA